MWIRVTDMMFVNLASATNIEVADNGDVLVFSGENDYIRISRDVGAKVIAFLLTRLAQDCRVPEEPTP